MSYDPFKRRRRPIRLKGHTYTSAGAYFVTLVSKNRENHYGQVTDTVMRLNRAGQMLDHWWLELANKFPYIILDYYVTMPNHLHGILWISEPGTTAEDLGAFSVAAHLGYDVPVNTVRADLRIRPDPQHDQDSGAHLGAPLQNARVQDTPIQDTWPDSKPDHIDNDLVGADLRVRPVIKRASPDSKHVSPMYPDLIRIMQWYKTMTTNAYMRGVKNDDWPPFPGKLWQRSFYDRIIRDRQELDRIRRYITANPAKWKEDRENPAAGK